MLRRPVIFILALSTAFCAGAKAADSLPARGVGLRRAAVDGGPTRRAGSGGKS